MAVAFDATSAAQTISGESSKSFSFSASGSNRVVFVVVSWITYPETGAAITMTYGGSPMEYIGAATIDSFGLLSVGVWKLVNPPTGSQTVALTANKTIYGVLGAVSFTGVDQTTPNGSLTAANGSSTTPSATEPATTSGNMVLGGLIVTFGSYTITAGRTLAYSGQERPGSGYSGGAEYASASGSSMAMNWTLSDSKAWAAFAMEILAAVEVPANTVAPAVTPTAGVVGDTFTTTTGTWSNSPTSYAYQWKLDGSNVGTNASTYAPVATGSLTCVVTASNAGGSGTPATSNAATRATGTKRDTVGRIVPPRFVVHACGSC